MPRKKQADFNEIEEEEKVEWDKPRIIIFFVILSTILVGGLLFKHFFLDAQNAPVSTGGSQQVQGALIQPTQDNASQLPSVQGIQQGAQQEIETLQKQASQISINDIASSSPQVQKIIQQIQQLPQLPSDIAKQTCEQLCGKL